MGDQLLIAVADRLVHAARPSDSIARLGGDEFVVVLEEIAGRDAATALAERLRHSIGGPMLIGDRSVTVSCSVGIALWDGHDATTLLQEADTALYHAKQSGRDRWELYDEAMRRQAWRRFEMEEHLRSALQADGVEVHFQPIVELETRRHIAHEALARLRAHDGTVIYPHEFIDVAEESDLIVALGATVLEKACHTYAMRSRGDPALERITVNVSARQLAAAAFIDHVIVALTTAGISPSALCLELTESVLIDAGGGVDARLHGLKALGVRIALDDFGTGWSSLAYLRRFPIDVVKIDRSFVTGLGTNDDDMELVRAVIGLGHALGHVTVAEGIETELQHEILCSLGCRYGQGFLYGRPMPA